MKHPLLPLSLLCISMVSAHVVQGQQLSVQDEVGKQTVLSRADIEAPPHTTVTVDNTASPITFEGVPLQKVMEKAGVGFGETLRGKKLASCLVVEAADAYRVVIALPELDPAFTDKRIVLAFLRKL